MRTLQEKQADESLCRRTMKSWRQLEAKEAAVVKTEKKPHERASQILAAVRKHAGLLDSIKSTASSAGSKIKDTVVQAANSVKNIDWGSLANAAKPLLVPPAPGAGLGAVGTLLIPQSARSHESAEEYKRRQRRRMIANAFGGAGVGIIAHAISNLPKKNASAPDMPASGFHF